MSANDSQGDCSTIMYVGLAIAVAAVVVIVCMSCRRRSEQVVVRMTEDDSQAASGGDSAESSLSTAAPLNSEATTELGQHNILSSLSAANLQDRPGNNGSYDYEYDEDNVTSNSTLRKVQSELGHLCRFDKMNQDEIASQFVSTVEDAKTLECLAKYAQLDEGNVLHTAQAQERHSKKTN